MAYNIRPLSFAEILDRAFRVVVDNIALLAGIACVMWVPYGILAAAAGQSRPVMEVLPLLLIVVVSPIVHVAIASGVTKAYLGQTTTIGGTYKEVWRIITPIMGTYLILWLLLIPAFILLFVPGVYLSVRWCLVAPIMVVERRFGGKALSRSRDLVKGVWWQAFGIGFVAGIIVWLPGMALSYVWSFIPVIGPILTAAAQGLLGTYPMVAIIVYYFDRRCRIEDFDLHLLAEQVRTEGLTAAVAPGATAGA